MWTIALAWAGEATEQTEQTEQTVEEQQEPRGSFSVSAGLSVGRVGDETLPMSTLGAGLGYEVGRQRRHLLRMDMDVLASRGLVYQRASMGWDLLSPEAP